MDPFSFWSEEWGPEGDWATGTSAIFRLEVLTIGEEDEPVAALQVEVRPEGMEALVARLSLDEASSLLDWLQEHLDEAKKKAKKEVSEDCH